MLARIWDGDTRAKDADEYVDYLRATGVADLEATAGNRGVFVLRREDAGRASFRLVSLWDSEADVRAFAGDEPRRARYYPEDERFLLALTPRVEHYEVVIGPEGTPGAREGAALAEELRATWSGDAWHGPALRDLLEGVTAARAAARPIRRGHSAWELVLHLEAWTDTWGRRLEGQVVTDPLAGDFPPVGEPSSEAWSKARSALGATLEGFIARVARLTAADLAQPVPGCDYDARFLVRGAIRHTVYHAGQIALLGKADGPVS